MKLQILPQMNVNLDPLMMIYVTSTIQGTIAQQDRHQKTTVRQVVELTLIYVWVGGATTHGQVQDTCQDGVGDACTQGTWWIFPSDNCTEAVPDECSATDNDACYDGTNTPDGHGGTDFCDPDPHPIGLGSDQCNDGTPEQDICSGNSTNPNDGLYDTCPGGETNVDTCAPTPPVNSEDYCVGGLPNNDECYPPDDSDECPGGGPNEDKCPTGAPPEDECTGSGGCSGGDQEGSEPPIDDCYAPQDSCTIASPDNPE